MPLPDIQSLEDRRGIAIDEAGIRGLHLPFEIVDTDGIRQQTVIEISAAVAVRKDQRGTHMSRLIEAFEKLDGRLKVGGLPDLFDDICRVADASHASIDLRFPWFVQKIAPVSGIRSTLDIRVGFSVTGPRRDPVIAQHVAVPVTTLCPCSKAISRYGAHNQRTIVTIDVKPGEPIPLDELVMLVEACASCDVYGILKRADEKIVTEAAYESPKFVEDVARDVFLALRRRSEGSEVRIHVESLESIHNHQAFALINGRDSVLTNAAHG